MENNARQHICYQRFYRTKAGKVIELVNNRPPKQESEDEDLILFQAVNCNIGYSVFRYTKTSIAHIKWFEERDQAIEYAFTESLKEQVELEKNPPKFEPLPVDKIEPINA
jgi:hypothetical protein